ncbi:MAG: hypothetical protein ACR2P1_06255 [Pseudomonadales bacterium]
MKFLNHRLAAAIFAASMANVACAEPGQGTADSMEGAVGQSEVVAPAFNDLDKDQDGYISAVEATGDSTLMDKWTAVDANSDRKIDRSEFSKFEARETQPGGGIPTAEGMNQSMEGTQEQQTQDQGTESQY